MTRPLLTKAKTLDPDPRGLDVNGLSVRLLAHVERRVRNYRWRGSAEALPKGLSPKGIALDAIASLFGGSKKWDPSKTPDPWQHLVDYANREISALSRCADNQLVPLKDHDQKCDVTPETELIAAERRAWETRALDLLLNRIIDDPELVAIHDLAEAQGLEKPSAIAAALGWPTEKVYNAQKRLNRHMAAVEEVLGEHLEGEDEDA